MKEALRRRLKHALRGKAVKNESTLTLLGCTVEQFKKHIESQWIDGMSWENYGTYRVGGIETWHVDHIKPCAWFDLTNPEEQRKCFHYTNMQPLWAVDNMRKGARQRSICVAKSE